MRYYKMMNGVFVSSVGQTPAERPVFGEIDKEEYDRLLALVAEKPEEVEGYAWKLHENGSWVMMPWEAEEEVLLL